MILDFAFPFLFSFLLGLVLAGFWEKIAKRFSLSGKKLTALGGLVIYPSFLIPLLLVIFYSSHIVSREFKGILLGATFIFLLGTIEEVWKLPTTIKFISKLLGAVILVLFGVKTKIVLIPAHFNLFISIIWVIGISYAFRLLDILDGLTIGLGVIISIPLLVAAIINHNLTIAPVIATLTGSSLAFLKYNSPSKKLPLGGGAALFVGFVLSAIAIFSRYATLENKIALLSPVIIFGLPIFHLLFKMYTMCAKFRKRLFFVQGSEDFISYLMARGYKPGRILSSTFFLGIFLSLCGIILILR